MSSALGGLGFGSDAKETFFGGAEEEAGEKQAQAARDAAELTERLFGETKEQLLPFISGGQQAFSQQQQLAGQPISISPLQSAAFGDLQTRTRQEITSPAFQRFQQQAGRPIESAALQEQQALSGALGANAQAQAFSRFRESPGQAFLREQGLAGVQGEAAISGGLGSGARLRELTRVSQGLAQQDFGSQFSRLGQVGAQEVALEQARRAELGGLAGTELGLEGTQFGRLGQLAGAELSIAGQQRQLELAEEANRFNRLGAVSGQGLGATQALAGVSGTAAAGQSQALQAAGQAGAAGQLGSEAAKRQTISQFAQAAGGFSDKRLKLNIESTGITNGFYTFRWVWNELANELGLFGEGFGVIADQVKETNPEAVSEQDGYLTVNYEMIGVSNG